MKFVEWLELAIDVIMLELNCGMVVTIQSDGFPYHLAYEV